MKRLISSRPFLFATLILTILVVSPSSATRTGLDQAPVASAAEPAPAAGEGTVRLLTWNVAHGRAGAFHQALLTRAEVEENLEQISRVLRSQNADVVALQEADGPSAWSGGFDHVEALGRTSGLEHSFHGDHNPFDLPRFQLTAGTALLSRRSIEETHSTAFDANWRDTKGFVVATVPIPGTERTMDVVSVHLDFLRPSERRAQILEMVGVLEGRGRPLAILGDLNSQAGPAADAFWLLAERLKLRPYEPALEQPTYPAAAPARRIDWILISDELEFVSHRTVEARLSDHLAVVADVRLAG